MNRYIRLLSILMLIFIGMLSAAAQRRFSEIGSQSDFSYSYISPIMLKAMPDGTIDSNGYHLRADQLESIETISTMTNGTSKELWDTIRAVIKEEGLETLSTNKNLNTRFDMLGKINPKNEITRLMLIQQNSGDWVTVTYMKGNLPVDVLQFNM